MDQQHFTILLKFLAPDDPEEAGQRYLNLHQKLEGYFRLRGVADPAGCADETLDRAGKRLADDAEVSDITHFCMGIARFIIMERWRVDTRESAAFLHFLELNESVSEDDLNLFSLMRSCLDQLPQYDRELLISYCIVPRGRERAQHRRELAVEKHFTVPALRIRVTRLRRGLDDCVKELSQTQ